MRKIQAQPEAEAERQSIEKQMQGQKGSTHRRWRARGWEGGRREERSHLLRDLPLLALSSPARPTRVFTIYSGFDIEKTGRDGEENGTPSQVLPPLRGPLRARTGGPSRLSRSIDNKAATENQQGQKRTPLQLFAIDFSPLKIHEKNQFFFFFQSFDLF